MENPIKMDDLEVPPFKETSIFTYIYYNSEVVSTHLWNTPLNLYQQATKGFFS